ncbi:MAG: endonuclease SmrB, partial [Shewanella sp.]
MNKHDDKEGMAMFSALIEGIKPITQDKRHFRTPLKSKQEIAFKA